MATRRWAGTGLGLLALAGGLAAGPASGAAASTADPVTSVKVGVTVPHWSRTLNGKDPYVHVTWAPTSAVPAGLNVVYDVEYREQDLIGGAADRTNWEPFVTHEAERSANLIQNIAEGKVETGDSYRLRARAVNLDTGAVGPWSDVAISNVPVDDVAANQAWEKDFNPLQYTKSKWFHSHNAEDYYGSAHTTTSRKRTSMLILGGYSGRYVAVFGTKCPSCGKFALSIDTGRAFHQSAKTIIVNSHSKTTQHGVLLAKLPIKDEKLLLTEIDTMPTAKHHRVTIDAWAVGD